MTDTSSAPAAVSLDDFEFVMLSSTASVVDQTSPTRFHYRQDGLLIWGEYTGDTVSEGRFIGRAVGDRIEISFAHSVRGDDVAPESPLPPSSVISATPVITGTAVSVVEQREDGLIYLVEDFEKDGVMHHSVCVQVR